MTDIELARLRSGLEQARTPAEMTAVLDLAAALQNRARRFRKAFQSRRDFVDAAREAYCAEVEAIFARLNVMVRIADALPEGPGRPEKMSDDLTISDWGISRDTAARWKRYRDALGDRDLVAMRADWLAHADDPAWWDRLALVRILYEKPLPVDTPPPPSGQYRTIVVDPPWPIERAGSFAEVQTGLDYPTMDIDAIAALPIGDLAADGCHVYLWVTHHFLGDGLAILEAWGARYECQMTWRKNAGMVPRSWMYDTEHVLFARIGKLPLVRTGLRLSFDAVRGGHSEKPDVFYDRVTEASPEPRLEMFARRPRAGWTVWGNEIA